MFSDIKIDTISSLFFWTIRKLYSLNQFYQNCDCLNINMYLWWYKYERNEYKYQVYVESKFVA